MGHRSWPCDTQIFWGGIIDFSGKEIVYNKKNLLNPNFIAASNKLLANNTKEILTNEKRK